MSGEALGQLSELCEFITNSVLMEGFSIQNKVKSTGTYKDTVPHCFRLKIIRRYSETCGQRMKAGYTLLKTNIRGELCICMLHCLLVQRDANLLIGYTLRRWANKAAGLFNHYSIFFIYSIQIKQLNDQIIIQLLLWHLSLFVLPRVTVLRLCHDND
jgi:hypothetical protein